MIEVDIKMLERCGIPKRFHEVTFKQIESRGIPDSIEAQYKQFKAYADNLEQNLKSGRGIILSGDYGTMKTTMVIALLRRHIKNGGSGLFVPMCSLIDNLYSMRILNVEEWARYEQKIRTYPLLILDDIGGENTDQKWILQKIDSIITDRYNHMRSTILTTNLPPFSKGDAPSLKNTYGGRVFDRLKNISDLILFSGKSLRKPS